MVLAIAQLRHRRRNDNAQLGRGRHILTAHKTRRRRRRHATRHNHLAYIFYSALRSCAADELHAPAVWPTTHVSGALWHTYYIFDVCPHASAGTTTLQNTAHNDRCWARTDSEQHVVLASSVCQCFTSAVLGVCWFGRTR